MSSTFTYKFYGRGKGRNLSKSKYSTLKFKGPKFLIDQNQIFEKDICVTGEEKNILEIGFGDGENLINLAKKFPKINFIAADPYVNSYIKVLEKILKYNLNNIKIWPNDIRLIINKFNKNIFDEIFIFHPDPWRKKRHQKRRLIQQSFINCLSMILKTNGRIILASDDNIMTSWILEQFHLRNDFEWKVDNLYESLEKPVHLIETKYSKKATLNNNTVNWFLYEKIQI